MTKLNLVKLNTSHIEGVQSERWTADKQDKEPRTLLEMRKIVVNHIEASIEALTAPMFVKTPMVRKERIGFAVKIGYGNRNEALAEIERCKTAEAAINTLEEAIIAVENGDFDEVLTAKLEGYRDRAEKGKLARQKNKQTLHAVA
jgi:hypothetical protein